MSDTIAGVNAASSATNQLFTTQSFRTLGGCVGVSGVVATTISGVFGLDPKAVGLISSIVVAYAALLLGSKVRRLPDYIVAAFNGFFIYFTLVGATSFYPYVNSRTAADVLNVDKKVSASVFAPWVRDRNLVDAGRALVTADREQAKTIEQVQSNVASLETEIARTSLSPNVKDQIARRLVENRKLLLDTRTKIDTKFKSLRPLGLRR